MGERLLILGTQARAPTKADISNLSTSSFYATPLEAC
jgi:hypothetical protein